MLEVAAPIVAVLSKADDTTKQKIKSEVYDLFYKKYPDGEVVLESGSLIISGQK